MTNEERDIISQFIARVGGAAPQSGFSTGSVPATQQALPPIDRDADAFIGQAFTQYPEARYRITQLAFVQEHALVEAQNRIKRLEWELQQAAQAVQQARASAQQGGGAPSGGGGGFFSGLFGGGRQQQQAGPPPGRRAVEPGRPAAAGLLSAIGAASAAISAELPAGRVPAAGRLRFPRVGIDHGGGRCRRCGGGQRAHEPVFPASERLWRRRVRRGLWRCGGQPVGDSGAGPGLRRYRELGPGWRRRCAARPIRIMWITAPGTSLPSRTIRHGRTTAAAADGTAAVAAVPTIRSRQI